MEKKILLVLGVVGLLFSCGETEVQPTKKVEEELHVKLVQVTEKFNMHTEIQQDFLDGDYHNIFDYTDCMTDICNPQSLDLNWKVVDDAKYTSYEVEISETEDFNDPWIFTSKKPTVKIKNLKLGTKYFWRVTSEVDGARLVSNEIGTFETENNLLRNLDCNKVRNFRDMGGYTTDNGEKVRQGLIFRSGRMSENYTGMNLLKADAIYALTNHLKIKTEIDLRKTENKENGDVKESPIGSHVNYFSIPCESSDSDPYTKNLVSMRKVFEVFGNKENYPIDFHCSIGTDRTGCIAFLIEALLGMRVEDIYKDYLFSNFFEVVSPRKPETIDNFMGLVNKCAGNNLKEKAENYALNLGIAQETINTIREVMLEK